jgi:hypothetical protein
VSLLTIHPLVMCSLWRLQRAEKPLVKAASRVSNSDFLVLEDENSRVHLVGDALHVNQLSTGVVCGVMGQAQENGDFQVPVTRGSHLSPAMSPLSPHDALKQPSLTPVTSRCPSSHAGEQAVLSRSERAACPPAAASGWTPAHAGAGVGTQGTCLPPPSDCLRLSESGLYASSTIRSSFSLHKLSTTDEFTL